MDSAESVTAADFITHVLRNPKVRDILARWDRLALPDGWLVAGCLFQTVWNLRSGVAPQTGIKDYDLFYFDASDLGEEAERPVRAQRLAGPVRGYPVAQSAHRPPRLVPGQGRFVPPVLALAARDGNPLNSRHRGPA